MGWSPLSTETHNTRQYSSRTRSVGGVVLHHAATTNADQVINMEVSGSKQVSSHQVVKNERSAGIVQEQFRAWSLSDAYWDSWALTVECANESSNGWTISDASHEKLAQHVADWARRYGFYPHRNGDPKTWTVIGHREVYSIHGGSYATACPGGMDLDRITRRAQEILGGVLTLSWDAIDNGKDPKGNIFRLGYILGNLGRKFIVGEDGGLFPALRGTILPFSANNKYEDLRPGGARNKDGKGGFSLDLGLRDLVERNENQGDAITRIENAVSKFGAPSEIKVTIGEVEAELIATKVAAKIAAGATKADVSAAVAEEFAKIYR